MKMSQLMDTRTVVTINVSTVRRSEMGEHLERRDVGDQLEVEGDEAPEDVGGHAVDDATQATD
jgi:hypothetical protein